jgi:hypothetical protein
VAYEKVLRLSQSAEYGDPSRDRPPQPISYTFTSAALLACWARRKRGGSLERAQPPKKMLRRALRGPVEEGI